MELSSSSPKIARVGNVSAHLLGGFSLRRDSSLLCIATSIFLTRKHLKAAVDAPAMSVDEF